MKLLTSVTIASLSWKAAAAVTAVTGCHLSSTQVYCTADATGYIVSTTATAASQVPTAYTGCHSHGFELFCITSSGDDVQIVPATEGDEEPPATEDHDSEEPLEENCHFHAGVEHCVGSHAGEEGQRSCERTDREYNIPLRVGLLFAILVTSALGVFAPIFISLHLPAGANSTLMVLKQFGTGVVISTSLVHLLTHAQLMFANECLGTLAYEATAAGIAMAGLFLSFLVEYLGHRFIKSRGASSTDSAVMSVYVLEAGIIFHSLIIGLTLVVSGDSFLLTLFAVILFHQMFEGLALGSCIAALGTVGAATISGHHHGHHGHHHQAAADYEAVATATPERQLGPAPGETKVDDLLDTGSGSTGPIPITLARKISLAALFALVTPAGMAIGIGVLKQFNGNDPQTIVAIGVLDALSAGVLLWVGIVEMWAADWTGSGALADEQTGAVRTAVMLASLVAGMVAMSVLGKWA